MPNQSDRPKQDRQSDCGAFLTLTFFTLASAQPYPVVTDLEMFEPHIQLASLSHHASFFRIADGSYRLAAGFGDDDIADLNIFIKRQIDRVALACSL